MHFACFQIVGKIRDVRKEFPWRSKQVIKLRNYFFLRARVHSIFITVYLIPQTESNFIGDGRVLLCNTVPPSLGVPLANAWLYALMVPQPIDIQWVESRFRPDERQHNCPWKTKRRQHLLLTVWRLSFETYGKYKLYVALAQRCLKFIWLHKRKLRKVATVVHTEGQFGGRR